MAGQNPPRVPEQCWNPKQFQSVSKSHEQRKHARRGHFYRPRKRQITARVDADVLDWLKAQGKGYQSRINAILRREMLTAAKSAK
jgi:uncharacterized protein (DUF4415 family)